jgi:hypothetical protein
MDHADDNTIITEAKSLDLHANQIRRGFGLTDAYDPKRKLDSSL